MFGLASGAVLISVSPVFVKAIEPDALGPAGIAFYRVFGGALVLGALARVRGISLRMSPRAFVLAALAGLFFAGDLSCWHRSVLKVGAGMSTLLANTQVVWVSLYGVLLLRERGGGSFWGCVALAVLGVALLAGVLSPAELPRANAEGIALGIATGLFYAAFILTLRTARTARTGAPPPSATALMAWMSLAAACFLGVEIVLTGESLAVRDVPTAANLLGLIVLIQVLGWVLLSRALPRVPAGTAALLLLLQPTLSTVWGALVFGERLTPPEAVGGALVLVAIYLGSVRPIKTTQPGRDRRGAPGGERER